MGSDEQLSELLALVTMLRKRQQDLLLERIAFCDELGFLVDPAQVDSFGRLVDTEARIVEMRWRMAEADRARGPR